MKTIQIDLPAENYRYQVKIGNHILKDCLTSTFSHYTEKSVYLITNETIHGLYPDFINKYLPIKLNVEILILPDGEKFKNIDTVGRIFDFLAEKKANRKSMLIALGGGVIGDMAGFAAATFMRGIAYLQIPTTLLSQVDSSIGGKTGINHPVGKNFIGAFKQPFRTIIDVEFLDTLPEREFRAGYAELIKHGFIRDSYLFRILEQKKTDELKSDKELLIEAIFRSCEVKARVVEADEKESNQRAILNFGHTLGHFLETFTNYEQLLHGEAVIIGMDFAAWWSWKQDILDKEDYLMVHNHLKSLGIKQQISKVGKKEFKTIIEHDKKAVADGIRFVGIRAIGDAIIFDKITAESLWNNFQAFLQTQTFLKADG
ncbi:MAG: 3-dehydroquinate synthase [Proteobacteria bacterium]|nr:3-dehydroquinate synthase [Pseudomonadota bacterium]